MPSHPRIVRAFGRVLHELRTQQNLTQEQLATSARVHRTYVSDLERGLKSPTLTTIARLAAELKLSPTELVRRAEGRTAQ